jgi:hypothetical protein
MLFVSVSYSQSYTKTTYLVDVNNLLKITSVFSLTLIDTQVSAYPCLKTNLYYYTSSYAIFEISTNDKSIIEKNFIDNLKTNKALIELSRLEIGKIWNGRIGGYENNYKYTEIAFIKVNISSSTK